MNVPLVELAIDEILRLVGACLGRESEELRKELLGHVARQLVADGQGFTGTGGTNTENLAIEEKSIDDITKHVPMFNRRSYFTFQRL